MMFASRNVFQCTCTGKKKIGCTNIPKPWSLPAVCWLIWKNMENFLCNIVHCVFYCNFSVTFLTLCNTVFPAHISQYMSITTAAKFSEFP